MDRTERSYGFTCTLASPVANWIGRCSEFLAFTGTIDKVLVPGASALITMPTKLDGIDRAHFFEF
jgi:hypothetical protein